MIAEARRHLLRHALVVAVATAISGCGLQQDIQDRSTLDQSRVTLAPALVGTALDGTHLDLASYRGHPVVVDFWASWCGPCRAQQPQLDSLAMYYQPRQVDFIGVDMRDDDASGRAYQQEFHVPYQSLADGDGAVAGAFDIAAPPTTLIIDAAGRIVLRLLGGVSRADLSTVLDRLLRSPG